LCERKRLDHGGKFLIRIREKERSARTSGSFRFVVLLSVSLPLYRMPMLLARRGIRRGLFCRFDTVSPWRQLKGYRVSYDRRRRLSPAAGIIKLKSHCTAALRGRAAINVTFIVQRNVTGQPASGNYSPSLVAHSSLPVLRAAHSPRKSKISRRMTSRYATIKRVSLTSNRDFIIVPFIADDIRSLYLSNIIFDENTANFRRSKLISQN